MLNPGNDPFEPSPIFLRSIFAFPKGWRKFLLYGRFVHYLRPSQEVCRQRFLVKEVNEEKSRGCRCTHDTTLLESIGGKEEPKCCPSTGTLDHAQLRRMCEQQGCRCFFGLRYKTALRALEILESQYRTGEKRTEPAAQTSHRSPSSSLLRKSCLVIPTSQRTVYVSAVANIDAG